MKKVQVADWNELEPLQPAYALVANVDLVVIRWPGRGAGIGPLRPLPAPRRADERRLTSTGKNLICGVHGWDYRYTTGVSSYNPEEKLHRFQSWVEDGGVWVDEDEIAAWETENPQPYDREAYQGLYKDHHGGPEEPHFQYIQHLAEHGLTKVGHHGRVAAMGVPRSELPTWDDIQILTAQLHKLPLLDDAPVGTEVVIGPNAAKPLDARHPALRLRHELRRALRGGQDRARRGRRAGRDRDLLRRGRHAARGAGAPTRATSTSWPRRASATRMDKVQKCQAFHFKGGQGAKTGTGGHLPGRQGPGQDRRGPRARRGRAGDLTAALSGLGLRRRSIAISRPRSARRPAGSRSGSSSRPSTSSATSRPPSRSASTTSSSMAEAAAPERRR